MCSSIISLRIALLSFLLFLVGSTNLPAADSPATLTVRDSGTRFMRSRTARPSR